MRTNVFDEIPILILSCFKIAIYSKYRASETRQDETPII